MALWLLLWFRAPFRDPVGDLASASSEAGAKGSGSSVKTVQGLGIEFFWGFRFRSFGQTGFSG